MTTGADLCRDNSVETVVRFDSDDFGQYVSSVPSHSSVLVGSAVDCPVFKEVPRDPGSVCANDYNPILNPTMPLCKSVSDDPSEWFNKIIVPRLSLEDALLDKTKNSNVSKDVARVFKETSNDLSQFAQCGYDFISHMLDFKVDVFRGIIKECPLKDHRRVFFEVTDLSYIAPHDVCKVYVYTDGGFAPLLDFEHTTWSLCIVIVDRSGRMHVWCSAGGVVPFEVGHPAFLGEMLPSSSFVAEVYAQVVAKIFVLQWFHKFALCPATPVVFVCDSTSANFVASSSVNSKAQSVLSEFASVIDTICVSILNIQYAHVHSHNLHPFNDYVDSICTHVRDRFPRTPLLIGPVGVELVHSAGHFWALLCGSVSQQVVLHDGGMLSSLVSIESGGIGNCMDGDGTSSRDSFGEGLNTREVKCVQFNICTGTPANRTALAVSMLKCNVFCMFVQEGRAKSAGVFMFEGIIVCRSQSLLGQYGCEVWINPGVVVGSHNTTKFRACCDNLSILSSKPRSIVVALVLGPFSCSLVSIHAPHSTSPQFTERWDDFASVWDVAVSSCQHVLCGADLNYGFGRHDVHPCVGNVKNPGNHCDIPCFHV